MLAEEWKENFRMGKDKLCGELRPFIERKVTNVRLPVSVDTQRFMNYTALYEHICT